MVAQVEPTLLKSRLPRKLPRGIVQVFKTAKRSFQTDVMVNALRLASQGNKVLIVQFFQGGIGQGLHHPRKLVENLEWLRADLSRNIDFQDPNLTEEEKANILSLWHFVQKVLHYGDYQLVVLDELPGLIESGLVEESSLLETIEARADNVNVVITGVNIPQSLILFADQVTHKRSEI